jgi:hypothetical protein
VLSSTGRIGLSANSPLQATTGDDGVARVASGVIAMKTIVSALIALSVLAGISATASALDSKTFWEQQERQKF